MTIDGSTVRRAPRTGEELVEEYRKSQKAVRKTMNDMVDIHNETVRKGQKERKAYYEKKDLLKKTDKLKEQRKALVQEDLEKKELQRKIFEETRLERESRRKIAGGKGI